MLDNMSAVQLDAWLLSEAGRPTDRAEFVLVDVWDLGGAVWLQAGHTISIMAPDAAAWMAALEYLVAEFVDHSLAFLLLANIRECQTTISVHSF